MRHVALPKPGDWTQLTRLAGRLHSLPLDMTRPLWEFWLVEGLDAIPTLPAGSYAIIWKLHHAAADAMASAELLSVLHDTSPDAKPMTAVQPWVADREPRAARAADPSAVQQPASAVPHRAARHRGRSRAAGAPRPASGPTRREARGGASGTPDALQRPHPRAAPGGGGPDLRPDPDQGDQEARRGKHRERRRRRDRGRRTARLSRAPRRAARGLARGGDADLRARLGPGPRLRATRSRA